MVCKDCGKTITSAVHEYQYCYACHTRRQHEEIKKESEKLSKIDEVRRYLYMNSYRERFELNNWIKKKLKISYKEAKEYVNRWVNEEYCTSKCKVKI